MPVRAVLFDLGNTLVSYYQSHEFRPILERCLECAAASFGLSLSSADAASMLEQALELNKERSDLAVRPLAGRLQTLFSAHRMLNEAELIGASKAFLAPIFKRAVLDAEAWDVLDALRARGTRTCIVSNSPWGSPADEWRSELSRHGLLDRVDGAVFCMDVGWRKPHVAPFERALEIVGAQPHEAFFVGDDPRWDVVGAEAAGIRPILILPAEEQSSHSCRRISRLSQLLDLLDVAS